MTPEQLLEALSYLDDETLTAAMAPPPSAEKNAARRTSRIRFFAAAAVFLLLLAGVRFAFGRLPKTPGQVKSVGDSGTQSFSPETTAKVVSPRQTTADVPEDASGEAPQPSAGMTKAAPAKRPGAAERNGQTRAAAQNQSGDIPTTAVVSRETSPEDPASKTPQETEKVSGTAAVTDAPSVPVTAPSATSAAGRFLAFFTDGGDAATTDALQLLRFFGFDDGNADQPSSAAVTASSRPQGTQPSSSLHHPKPTPSLATDAPTSTVYTEDGNDPWLQPEIPEGGNVFGAYAAQLLRMEDRLGQDPASALSPSEAAAFGTDFLPADFPGTDSAPLPQGAYYRQAGEAEAYFSRFAYQWTGTEGDAYRLLVYVLTDDGSFPAAALSARAPYADADGVRIYLRSDSETGASVHTALLKHGDTVLWATLTGVCTQTQFLRLIRSAPAMGA